jgi:hypothetical protein
MKRTPRATDEMRNGSDEHFMVEAAGGFNWAGCTVHGGIRQPELAARVFIACKQESGTCGI